MKTMRLGAVRNISICLSGLLNLEIHHTHHHYSLKGQNQVYLFLYFNIFFIVTITHLNSLTSSRNPNYIHVTLGAYHLADVSSVMVMRSIHYVVHEGWDPNTHQNDVALVKLPYNVTFTEFVQPVGLDRGGGDHDENIATTIGQGGTTVLMQIMDVVMSNEECAKASSTYRKVPARGGSSPWSCF